MRLLLLLLLLPPLLLPTPKQWYGCRKHQPDLLSGSFPPPLADRINIPTENKARRGEGSCRCVSVGKRCRVWCVTEDWKVDTAGRLSPLAAPPRAAPPHPPPFHPRSNTPYTPQKPPTTSLYTYPSPWPLPRLRISGVEWRRAVRGTDTESIDLCGVKVYGLAMPRLTNTWPQTLQQPAAAFLVTPALHEETQPQVLERRSSVTVILGTKQRGGGRGREEEGVQKRMEGQVGVKAGGNFTC
ncbi:hypothetical protein E2C01_068864 [Portunus trituberculatus]|uniref:Uncharacterized protein n=1 Tax=Portunus trituberculatus TaxID=210409 RepID=A0A5B7I1A0_PORTR|nr:hypothetical protein [Portunus trituberculatus]